MAAPEPLHPPLDAPTTTTAGNPGVFVILLGLYALILYPILRADRAYDDDLKRALIGRAGWDSNGRPLTTLLMRTLQCYDHAMVDISPLPQVGAILVLSLVGMLLARRHALGPPWMAALMAFPLGAQPFFLENLSYKFDALSMSLAMLLGCLPLLRADRDRRDWWLGVLALFLCLNLYQPAINVYLVFALLELVLMQLDDASVHDLASRALRRALQFTAGMGIYELLVGIHISGWVRRHAAPIDHWSQLPLLERNFRLFYGRVGEGFNAHWWMYFAPALVLLAVLPAIIGIRYALHQRGRQPLAVIALLALCGAAMPLTAMIGALGPMLLLQHPELYPRVFMGLGALLSAGLVVLDAAVRRGRHSPRWTSATGAMLALGMLVLASAYGNAMTAQKRYEDRIGGQIQDDVATLPAVRGLVVDGSAGYAPLARHVVDQLPLMRALVPRYLTAGNAFDTRNFLMYFVPRLVNPHDHRISRWWADRTTLAAATCGLKPRSMTAAFRLYLVRGVAVVRFDRQGATPCLLPGREPEQASRMHAVHPLSG